MSYQLKVKFSRRAFRFPLLDPAILSTLDLKDDERVVVQSKKGKIIAPDVFSLDTKDKDCIGLDDNNLEVLDVAIGDMVSISKIKVMAANWVILKPIEEPAVGLAEKASRLLRAPLNNVPVFLGQKLTLMLRYDRFRLVVAGFSPLAEVIVITRNTEVLIVNNPPKVEYSIQEIVKKDNEKQFIILKLSLTFRGSLESVEYQRAIEGDGDVFAFVDKCKQFANKAIKNINEGISKTYIESDRIEAPDLDKIKRTILSQWNKE